MRARKATVELQYNGAAVKTSLKEFGEAFSYTDPAGGSSDSISLTVGDPRYQWISAWLPHKGDQITAKISFADRDGDDKTTTLDCGMFTLDGGKSVCISWIWMPEHFCLCQHGDRGDHSCIPLSPDSLVFRMGPPGRKHGADLPEGAWFLVLSCGKRSAVSYGIVSNLKIIC